MRDALLRTGLFTLNDRKNGPNFTRVRRSKVRLERSTIDYMCGEVCDLVSTLKVKDSDCSLSDHKLLWADIPANCKKQLVKPQRVWRFKTDKLIDGSKRQQFIDHLELLKVSLITLVNEHTENPSLRSPSLIDSKCRSLFKTAAKSTIGGRFVAIGKPLRRNFDQQCREAGNRRTRAIHEFARTPFDAELAEKLNKIDKETRAVFRKKESEFLAKEAAVVNKEHRTKGGTDLSYSKAMALNNRSQLEPPLIIADNCDGD